LGHTKHQEMKIIVLTCMHARSELNRIFGMAMVRLRNSFDIDTVAAVTSGDTKNYDICKEFGIHYTTEKNKPVSDKFNTGLSILRHFPDWTHVMILGSDDFPSNRFIELQMEGRDNDFICVADMWFWGLNPKRPGWDQFYYWKAGSSRIGAGRCISRRVVEVCDYKLWPPGYNAGLDGQSVKRIKAMVPDLKSYSYTQREVGGFLIDIKYEMHISSLSPIIRRCAPADPNILWDHLPGEECEALFRLREQIKEDNGL